MPIDQSTLTVVNHAKGGIGNQLFQEAFARTLAAQLAAKLRTDTSFYARDPYGFSAAVWNLDPSAQETTLSEHRGNGCYLLKEGQIRAVRQVQSLPTDAHALVLDGYWQGEEYFDTAQANGIYARLVDQVAPRVDSALQRRIAASINAVAVHVRRRDYGHMGICKAEYFIAAIDHLQAYHPDAEFFVFTDEPNYTRHLLAGHTGRYTLVQSGSDLGDLYLMTLCRHFVISNSSFSWWGAWFGEQRNGPASTVVCPDAWVTFDATPSPCPSRWLRVAGAVVPCDINAAEVTTKKLQLQRHRFNAAVRRWFQDQGDNTRRVQFDDLDATSVVLDLGGYKGDWTAEISRRYDCRVLVFEPIKSFHDQIAERFKDNSKIQTFQFGLGASDQSLQMQHAADGTGAFVKGESEHVDLRQAQAFLRMHGIERIDMLKINIEGGEFDLLDHLIDTGDIQIVRRLQVQFHDFVDRAIERRTALRRRLQATHLERWNYDFVWEEWVLAKTSARP